MDRRRFLRQLVGGLAGAVAASTFDPEQLLWVPGAKTFFLPPVSRNTLLPPEWVTKEVLRMLQETMAFTKYINRNYDEQFIVTGMRTGEGIVVRRPTKYVVAA